ncbi:MAG TPA: hypothetical protein VJ937_03595 [Salinivirga sp.]|uniref:hypothetical protein n=1 Tax=Salinivirga sp. TaxID=1970192 RepID=UPI002B45C8B8|nr:hypothetical protein [Salinivirga sp.]HKK58534.1 hypothetical protein [Salinivirga sp.]
MRYIIVLSLIFLSLVAKPEGLALIEDDQNRLFIFDKGNFNQVEHNKVLQKHIGSDFVAYIDYMNDLKVYYNGKLTEVAESINSFVASEDLIAWKISNYLYVWQDGITKQISRDVRMMKTKGEILFFEDDFDNALKIYYKHKVYLFAQNHYSLQTKALDIGRESLAVLDGDDQLFVFSKGDMHVQKFTQQRILFSAGGDGILVKNFDTGALEFISGEDIQTLEYFPPTWFKTRYNWQVWIDQSGNFNYWDGTGKELLTYQKPRLIEYSPEALLYENGNQLYAMHNGTETYVCDYIPEVYQFYNNYFVFYNRQRQVELVENGNSKVISTMPEVSFDLYFDVIVLREGRKRRVYYNGKIYTL